MGNRICVGQQSRQVSSSKKYKEDSLLEERERNTNVKPISISERFLEYTINKEAMDDLDSVFMIP